MTILNPGMTTTAYQQQRDEWYAYLAAQTTLPADQRQLPDEAHEWFGVWARLCCHTPGCPAEDQPDTRRIVHSLGGVQAGCAQCRRPTRIIASFADGELEIENTYPDPTPALPDPGDGGGEGPQEGSGDGADSGG